MIVHREFIEIVGLIRIFHIVRPSPIVRKILCVGIDLRRRPCPSRVGNPVSGRSMARKESGWDFTPLALPPSLLYTSYGSAAISAACSAAGRTHENGLTTAMPVTSPTYYFYPASILHSLYKRNSSMTIFSHMDEPYNYHFTAASLCSRIILFSTIFLYP